MMATWMISPKGSGFDVHYQDAVRRQAYGDSCLTRCTTEPQPYDMVIGWVLDAGQASFCDIIEQDGRQFVVLEAQDV
jgi:hypothetical protein